MGTAISYRLRRLLSETPEYLHMQSQPLIEKTNFHLFYPRTITLFIGALVGITLWLPMTYTNFYVTKVLDFSTATGMYISLIALLGYIFLSPICGYFSDKIGHIRWFKSATLITCPFSILFFYMLTNGYLWQAQLGLITLAAGIRGAYTCNYEWALSGTISG